MFRPRFMNTCPQLLPVCAMYGRRNRNLGEGIDYAQHEACLQLPYSLPLCLLLALVSSIL